MGDEKVVIDERNEMIKFGELKNAFSKKILQETLFKSYPWNGYFDNNDLVMYINASSYIIVSKLEWEIENKLWF